LEGLQEKRGWGEGGKRTFNSKQGRGDSVPRKCAKREGNKVPGDEVTTQVNEKGKGGGEEGGVILNEGPLEKHDHIQTKKKKGRKY